MKEEKRNTYLLMASFVIAEILALVFANNILISKIPVEQYQPFGNENVVQASANSGILIVFVLIFTLFLVAVIKLGFRSIFRFIAIGLPVFFLFMLLEQQLGLVSLYVLNLSALATNIVFVLIIGYVILVLYSILKGITFVTTTAFLLATSLIGAYLAVSISPPTLFILPIAFALYDIYAVFRGPLKTLIKVMPITRGKTAKSGKQKSVGKNITADLQKQFGLMLARIGGFTIGAGDFTFYSMLVAAGFVLKGLLAAVVVGVAINAGVIATLWILQKYKKPLPGLPIPIFLGIIILIVF
jgi:presenilin-like A22 family membrane protease